MGKLWVVTCDGLANVLVNRAEARREARRITEHGGCTNPHTVLELDAWNLLMAVDLDRLRTAVNMARDFGFNYANVYQVGQPGDVVIIVTPNRQEARYLHQFRTLPRDYVVPVAAVEAAWNQRTN